MQSSRALEVASEPWDEGVAIELECLCTRDWRAADRMDPSGGGLLVSISHALRCALATVSFRSSETICNMPREPPAERLQRRCLSAVAVDVATLVHSGVRAANTPRADLSYLVRVMRRSTSRTR